MSSNPSLFVYTEIVRCGQIGTIALRSFYTYHPKQEVHVFGLESDRSAVKEFPHVVFHSLDEPDPALESWGSAGRLRRLKMTRRSRQIARNFNQGHRGTASLWAHLIQTRPETYLLHFDSDVVFRGKALSDITDKLAAGYDLIGPIRNYRHNPHNDASKREHSDVTGTSFFAYNRRLIPRYSFNTLTKMCQGLYNPLGFGVIDFFDPVAFVMLKHGAKISFLSVDDYGGQDKKGGRVNKYPKLNPIVDFGDKMAHFSAVGSGMNFYQNRASVAKVPDSYIQYGLEKYAVYMKLFYDTDIDVRYDKKPYLPLFAVKKWY